MDPVKFQVTPRFGKEKKVYSRLHDVIHEYDGELSLVAAIGVIELLKQHVMGSCK